MASLTSLRYSTPAFAAAMLNIVLSTIDFAENRIVPASVFETKSVSTLNDRSIIDPSEFQIYRGLFIILSESRLQN